MKLEVDFKPTENKEKLVLAVKNLFPDADLKVDDGKLVGNTDARMFDELAGKEKIRATIAEESKKGYVDLSKMAALAGRAGLDESFPLGKIRLILK